MVKRLSAFWLFRSAHRFFLCLAALFFLTACSASTAALPAKEAALPDGILFQDDFSNPPSGWGIWSQDGASVEYYSGGIRIQVNEEQYDFWTVAGHNFGDAQIEVDAAKIGGPEDNDFGIICRYVNKENFYMLVISSDGYYGIAKLKDGQYSMIGSDQLQYSPMIANGQGINRLRADCVGTTLALYANGEKLMEGTDVDFSSGDVGLLAGAYDVRGVDIFFDNFVVKRPE